MKTINSFISEKLKITKHMINNQRDGYEYVDLDLPSGTLWAKCNIGANDEHECGDYFAWGETEPKKEYIWKSYAFGKTITKYNNEDKLTKLEPEDDAAYVNMGSNWRIPSTKHFYELLEKTKWEFVKNYNNTNINGMLFTGKNGNTLFLPCAGYKYGTTVNKKEFEGHYQTRNSQTFRKNDLKFSHRGIFKEDDPGIRMYNDNKCDGCSVRAVTKK
jgi:hypothetical protein